MKQSLLQIHKYFLRLGLTGFGGPLALVATMQKELVEEKGWIELQKFQKILPLLKSMPGAFAFQTAVYFGYQKAGRWGAFIAGVSLLIPSFLLMIFLSHFLIEFSESRNLQILLQGFQWGALAIMAGAIPNLMRGHQKRVSFWIFLVLGCTLFYLGVSEILCILLLGLLSGFIHSTKNGIPHKIWNRNWSFALPGFVALNSMNPTFEGLFWICFKAGAFVFGTGLAITPMLEHDFVRNLGWMTHSDFMTALAFGQMTPGPVLITVTMIGYKLLGWWGALLATVAVFLPGYIHMTTWFPIFSEKLIRMAQVQNFLKGALAAVVAAIIVTLLQLIPTIGHPAMGLVSAIVSIILLLYFRWPSWLLILGSGVLFLAAQIIS